MTDFSPIKSILPESQQQLWPQLARSVDFGMVLYGGTAIALRLGHRQSVDFDFFTEQPLDREAIREAFPFMQQAVVLQDAKDSYSVVVPMGDSVQSHVQVSFFGSIGFGRVGRPDLADDGVLQAASMDDLMATKLKVILQRAEAKDYRDIAAMINAGTSLSKGLGSAQALFGPAFQPSESLKALTFFNDGDLSTLTPKERSILCNASASVGALPDVELQSRALSSSSARNGDSPTLRPR